MIHDKYKIGAEYQLAQRILSGPDADGEKTILALAYMAALVAIKDEPTEEMVKAGAFFEGRRFYGDEEVRNIYKDMRGAA
jgi:hypothetical protein